MHLNLVTTLFRLGLGNVLRVMRHRLRIRFGALPAPERYAHPVEGGVFRLPGTIRSLPDPMPAWKNHVVYFSWLNKPIGESAPDWFVDPFSGHRFGVTDQPWHLTGDGSPEVGDIKVVWELSRWDWVVVYAILAARGELEYLDRMNMWLQDWIRKNPAGRGPNWKCGQEASFRVMHLALAALILDQVHSPETALQHLIRMHLGRIRSTIGYAIAQDNNHGTSEAAALYIGGSWLAQSNRFAEARGHEELGRRILENRVNRLIASDGSFSQYSTNYHRVVLDTLSVVELWRRRLDGEDFSDPFREKCRAAARWMHACVNPSTGETPNIGSNDGARVLSFDRSDYTDYRPSMQLASALFLSKRAFPDGQWNDLCRFLMVEIPKEPLDPPGSGLFDDGGLACLRAGKAVVFVRYPRYRFRPGHADALHVDLWIDRQNILRDSGTYSYSTDTASIECFSGTKAHNTIEFDGRNQMPRIGRFLFGRWLKTRYREWKEDEDGLPGFEVSYRDDRGCVHIREVRLTLRSLTVVDRIRGFESGAVLRWRLIPGDWSDAGDRWTDGRVSIRVQADVPSNGPQWSTGYESRYYMQKTEIPVLEFAVTKPGTVITQIEWPEVLSGDEP